jgi:hypothetical protein
LALLFSLTPLIGIPGNFIAPIIIGFVTLCRGAKVGLFVLAWVAIPVVALLYLGRFGVNDFVLLRCVIVWLLAVVLRRFSSWTLVAEVAMLVGILAIVSAHVLMPDLKEFWVTYLTQIMQEMRAMMSSFKMTASQTESIIRHWAPIASGTSAFLVLLGSWLMLFVARWWQSAINQEVHLKQSFIAIRNRPAVALIFLAGLLGVMMKLPVVIDVSPVLLLPLVVGGLSFLHFLVAMHKHLLTVVILVYVGMLFFLPYMIILLSLIGFFDVWVNFRKYFNKERTVV